MNLKPVGDFTARRMANWNSTFWLAMRFKNRSAWFKQPTISVGPGRASSDIEDLAGLDPLEPKCPSCFADYLIDPCPP